MQNKHGLWALGVLEAPILDYLETHYAPTVSGSGRGLAEHLLPGELINGAKSAAVIQPRNTEVGTIAGPQFVPRRGARTQ